MRRIRPTEALLLIAPLPLLPVVLFGLSSGSEERFRYPRSPSRTVSLVVLTAHQKSIQVEIEEGFKRWLFDREGVGVDVTWMVQSGSTALRYVRQQYDHRAGSSNAGGIGIDVMFGAGIDPYDKLKDEGRLVGWTPPAGALDGIPEDVGGFPTYDVDGCWYGTCVTGFGIMTNTRVLEVVPQLVDIDIHDWDDLADPRLLGWVGAADPRSSSSSHACFEILLQAYGFEAGMGLARRIGANVRAFSKSSSEIPRLCAVGEVACGLTIDFYALAQIDKVGDVIRFVLPEGNTLVNGDAAGILAGGPNTEASRWFMEYLLSPDAARLWMLRRGEEGGPKRYELNRGAIRPAIYEEVAGRSNVRDNPFAKEYRFRYDFQLASRRWGVVNDLIGALIIDPHDRLKAAIAAVQDAAPDRREALERSLFELPVTEAEIDDMASRWNDPEFQARVRIAWSEFARRRYDEVRAAAGAAP